jgi:predicted Zn-dependent peptidase
MDQMLWIGDSTLMLDRMFALSDVIRQVDRVRAQDVREAARRIFRDETLNLALIGPQKSREKDIRGSLHIG